MSNYSIGLSGLNSNSAAIDTISNNIANASTVGYKAGEYIFQDQFYKAINPLDPARAGQGTAKQNIRRLMNMGTVQDSQNTLDMAITGSMGMFRLSDANDPDTVYYTRNGQFAVSKEVDPNFPKRSYIVNQNGMFLTGYSSQDGTTLGDSWTDKITMPPTELEPQTTTVSTIAVNLDARTNTFLPSGKVPFNPDVPSSYNNKISQTVYSADDNGGAHTLTLYYRRVDDKNMTVTYNGATFQYPASEVARNILSADEANVVLTNDTSDGMELVSGAARSTSSNSEISSATTSFNVKNTQDVNTHARVMINGIDSGKFVTTVGGEVAASDPTRAAVGDPYIGTVTLSGNYAAGDVIRISIGSANLDYTVTAANVVGGGNTTADFNRIRDSIVTAYNASTNATIAALTASGATAATITLTHDTDDTDFDLTSSVSGNGGGVNVNSNVTSMKLGDKVEFFNPATSVTGATSSSTTLTIAATDSQISAEQFVYKLTSAGTYSQVLDDAGKPVRVSSNNGLTIGLSGTPATAIGATDRVIFYDPVSYRLTYQDGTKVSMAGDLFKKTSGQTFDAVTTKYEIYGALDDKFYNHNDARYRSEPESFAALPVGDGPYKPIAEMQFWGGKNIDSVVTNPVNGLPTFESSVYLTGKVTTPGNTAESTDPDLIFKLDLTGTRNYATPFGVDQSTQDGRSVALLNSVTISDAGEVVGTYGDGRTFLAGQVVLVNFAATDGLVPSGNNVFAASYLSGDEVHPNVTVGKPGAKGLGGIRAGAVEGSNVDLANELVKLLIQQRMYSANSQSIRAFDDTLTTTIRMAGG